MAPKTPGTRGDKSALVGREKRERIEAAIRFSGATKTAIAQQVGISTSAMREWLRDADPSPDNLRKFAAACGVSARWVETGAGDPIDGDEPVSQSLGALIRFLATPGVAATDKEIALLEGASRLLGPAMTPEDWRRQLALIRRSQGLMEREPDEADLEGYPKAT